MAGSGTREDPWVVKTPSGQSEYQAYRDESSDPPALVAQVGKTEVRYHLRAVEDLHAMLVAHGDWMPLGTADEQKPAAEGTVEAWARSPDNPVGGWYGLKKGLRGRFGNYVPPVLEALGLAEVEHNPRNNRMRALSRAGVAAPETPSDSPLTMDQALASPLYRDLSTPKLAVGDPAFDFELARLDCSAGLRRATGETVRLADLAGVRPVALVFGSYT